MDDFIEVYDNVLTPEQCAALIARFEASDKISAGRAGDAVDPRKKKSLDIAISHHPEWRDAADMLVQATRPHLKSYLDKYRFLVMGAVSPTLPHPWTGSLAPLVPENYGDLGRPNLDRLLDMIYRFGDINIQKYLKADGHYAHWHSEFFPQLDSTESLHRVLLWSYYLNDIEDAGETEFFYQQRKVAPRAGRLVIAPAGFTHTHRGNRSPGSDKYIATSWILYQRAEVLYRKPAA
jgi:hypothetical protein